MSNLKMSKLAVAAVAVGAVILFSAETTQAGGFSVRVGGVSLGSWNTRCVERSYIYISNYDDDWGCNNYVIRERYRPCYRYYDVRPYRGGGHFRPMPFHGRPHGHHRGRHHP